MTIDEAIEKMEDLSEKQYKLSEISLHEHAKEANHKNAKDSRQIAKWLQELKELKDTISAETTWLTDEDGDEYRVVMREDIDEVLGKGWDK